MKKYISAVIIVLVIIILLVLMLVLKDNKNDNNYLSNDPNEIIENANKESEAASKREDLQELKQISVDDYINYYNSQDKTIVLISNTDYEYCKVAEPLLKEIQTDNKLEIKVIYLDRIDETESKRLQEVDTLLESIGPPLLTIVGNNSIINKVDGLTDKAHYLQFFKDNGIIK